MTIATDLFLGDSKEQLKLLPDQTVDLFLPISEQLLKVFKPTGTFVLNIKQNVVEGVRSTYGIELIMILNHIVNQIKLTNK